MEAVAYYLEPNRPFALRPNLIKQLHKIACDGLIPDAGEYRKGQAGITGSRHTPPPPHLVEPLVQEMCDYVNDNLHERPPIHLAAYVMWRLNWIHPFSDGNGRTSRIVSYIVLNLTVGYVLPGSPTIPQQIQADRTAYLDALGKADDVLADTGEMDLSDMEGALRGMLAKQLLSVIERAGGAMGH